MSIERERRQIHRERKTKTGTESDEDSKVIKSRRDKLGHPARDLKATQRANENMAAQTQAY